MVPPSLVDRTVSTVSVPAYPLADLLSLCLCCLTTFGCKANRSTSLHLSVDGGLPAGLRPLDGHESGREFEREEGRVCGWMDVLADQWGEVCVSLSADGPRALTCPCVVCRQ